MTKNEFAAQQKKAIEQMKEMNAKSTESKLPPPQKKSYVSPNSGFELPFANMFNDKDTVLILGLLLILYGEKTDKVLLYALLYILL